MKTVNCLFSIAALLSINVSHAADSGASRAVIEEVVVTAEKRESTLMKTPVAISAFGSSAIDQRQLRDIKGLEEFVPSLNYYETPNGVSINMRGIGSDISTVGAEPGVPLYLDGVLLGHAGANTASFYNLERIEVLRGPQGTLYGRNSTGGSVNFIRKLPEFEPNASMDVVYGSDSLAQIRAAGTSGIIDDLLAIRLVYAHEERDGYRRNRATGRRVEDKNEDAVDFSLLLTPASGLEFLLRADWVEQERGRALTFLETDMNAATPPITQTFGAQTCGGDSDCVYNNADPDFLTRMWGVSGTLTWDITHNVTLRSITGYREGERSFYQDSDGTDIWYLDLDINSDNYEDFSQEINLLGEAFGGRIEWIAGLYYYQNDNESQIQYSLETLTPILEAINVITDVPTLWGEAWPVAYLGFAVEQELKSYAVFGQATFALTDRTRATVGVRYTDDDKQGVQYGASNFSPGNVCPGADADASTEQVTGKLGVDFDLSDTTMVYASVAKGYKGGGFTLGECGNTFDPETLWAYEVGLKGRFFEDRLHVSTTAFFYDYTDLQVRKFVETTALILNAADAEVYGLETEIRAMFGGWEIDAGITVQNAEFLDDFETVNASRANQLVDLEGTQLQRAPDFKGNLGIQYTFDLGGSGTLVPRYEYAHVDDQHTDLFDDPWGQIDAYSVHNFRIDWRSADGTLGISGFVENMRNEEYLEYLNVVPTNGGNIGLWAPPRTWGVRVSYRMGP